MVVYRFTFFLGVEIMRNTIIALSLAVLAVVHVFDFADRNLSRHDEACQQAYNDGYDDGAASVEVNPFD